MERGVLEIKTFTYVYDNEGVIVENLTRTDEKVETTRYLHGPGVDGPIAVEREKESFYYHSDGLGSITALSDARQKAVKSYDYTSFGELKQHGDKIKNIYTFTGREWDEEIGLYYYRARYLDVETGRFISFDPILRGFNHIKEASALSQSIAFRFKNLRSYTLLFT